MSIYVPCISGENTGKEKENEYFYSAIESEDKIWEFIEERDQI